MPEFLPGASKVAIAPMSNPTAKAFDYSAELYMGTDLALMVSKEFHLEADETKDITLPITMPSVAGTYPVFLGVFSNGQSIALYQAEDVVIAALIPLEILGLVLNGSTHPTVNPRAGLSARVLVRANQVISFADAHIYFGKGYDKGTEPQPLSAPEGYREAVMDYLYKGDKAFLLMPILGKYECCPWAPLIIYFNGHSQWRGTSAPWYYTTGYNMYWSWGAGPFPLTPGEHSLVFPRPDIPSTAVFLPVKVSDEIRGTVDALVLINGCWAIFKDILTITTSPRNPEQVTVDTWISGARQPVSEPTIKSLGVAATGLNFYSVLAAPRRTGRAVVAVDADISERRQLMSSVGAGISYNTNTFNKVIVPEGQDIEEEIDLVVAREHDIRIDRGPLNNAIFIDKGTVEFWILIGKVDVGSPENLVTLLQFSVADACLGLGVSSGSVTLPSNDVLINGKKIAGIMVRSIRFPYEGRIVDGYSGILFCNLDFDTHLAEAVLKGKVKASDMTSISAELGYPVSEDTFRRLFIQAISTRFNRTIYY